MKHPSIVILVGSIIAGCSPVGSGVARVEIRTEIQPSESAGFPPQASPVSVQTVSGSAVYIGQGRFLTAAHVIGGQSSAHNRPFKRFPAELKLNGKTLLATKEIASAYNIASNNFDPNYSDLGLLLVDESSVASLVGEAATVCADLPAEGTPVSVRAARGTFKAKVSELVDDFSSVDFVLMPGDSGAGVYADNGCLIGIVSQQWPTERPTETLIVPSRFIRSFLAAVAH